MVQQQLTQVLLLHARSKHFLRTANEKKKEAMHKLNTYVEMTHETEFTTVDFVILKVVKKNEKEQVFF